VRWGGSKKRRKGERESSTVRGLRHFLQTVNELHEFILRCCRDKACGGRAEKLTKWRKRNKEQKDNVFHERKKEKKCVVFSKTFTLQKSIYPPTANQRLFLSYGTLRKENSFEDT
jgi:hypothetical protein